MAAVAALDYGYALRHQLRAGLDRGDPNAFVASAGDRAPVVLLPGIFESWRFLRPLGTYIHDRGHPVHIVTALQRNLATIDEGARLVADYLEAHDLWGVSIVAHSKGGLIAKQVMGMPGVGERVRLTVAVSTPFAGSALAAFTPFRSVRALRPSNAMLVDLARARDANERIVSVAGWFDPHIPNGSFLDGARNVTLPVGGHFRILASPELLRLVDRCLDVDG
ncbi:MAG: triacylglycerol lipase [Microbacteriaceae bacterium]|jgi:pimeloyl-ACP methyl ester carboxylesterase|nr:triacylglycerol lipase [Microbacteriaceae bacterium]